MYCFVHQQFLVVVLLLAVPYEKVVYINSVHLFRRQFQTVATKF